MEEKVFWSFKLYNIHWKNRSGRVRGNEGRKTTVIVMQSEVYIKQILEVNPVTYFTKNLLQFLQSGKKILIPEKGWGHRGKNNEITMGKKKRLC